MAKNFTVSGKPSVFVRAADFTSGIDTELISTLLDNIRASVNSVTHSAENLVMHSHDGYAENGIVRNLFDELECILQYADDIEEGLSGITAEEDQEDDSLSFAERNAEKYKEILIRDAKRRMREDGITDTSGRTDPGAYVDWCWSRNAGRWPDGSEIHDD